MSSQVEWEEAAQSLGVVVTHFLEEFDDTCRGSEHKSEAHAALQRLSRLVGQQHCGPVGNPHVVEFSMQAHEITEEGRVVIYASSARRPVIHILDGLGNPGIGKHHSVQTGSLAAALLKAANEWAKTYQGGTLAR